MIRARFYINKTEVKNDYRPIVWPIKYPYWCTEETDTDFILVAYIESTEDLYKQWPEAYNVSMDEVSKVEYSDRFPKPSWYEE